MQKKIFRIYVILLIIGVMTTGLFSIELLKTVHINSIEDKLDSNLVLIREFIENTQFSSLEDMKSFDDVMKGFSRDIGSRITVINDSGRVLLDSYHDIETLENHSNRPEIIEALRGNRGKSTRYSTTAQETMFYIAMPIRSQEKIIGAIRLSLPITEINKIYYRFGVYIAISIVIGLMAATILGYRYFNSVINPIKEIAVMSEKIAHGDFKRRVKIISNDEIGKLAGNFNYMAEKLQSSMEELTDKNTKLEAILTSSINGVIAVDNYQRVIIINPTAEKIFGIDSSYAVGKNILEIIRNNKLDQSIKDLFISKTPNKIEIEISYPEHKILNIYTNPIIYKKDKSTILGALTLIQDISEIKKLERIRTDFVSNVTHELRTPLTSIKGFVETLLSGALDNKEVLKRFLDIINLEAERLARLIDDILTLSEIENKKVQPPKEILNVNEIIDQVLIIMRLAAEKKNISIEKNIDTRVSYVYCNRDRFKQILINLIDNGIKYGIEGGFVRIFCAVKDNLLIMEITDNGKGISSENIPRLFERFYKVDKARTGGQGTGLGLAIVKHIILNYKGTIEVDSSVNKGTKFIVKLPIVVEDTK